ncbi:MAG: hypothetical protein GY898_26950 [Proteobacteria bacterium]|nr:hypothetical protein [Pseudomonadota bacterium]
MLDGATGAEHWHLLDMNNSAGTALVDVDGDGEVEILAKNDDTEWSHGADGFLIAVNLDGTIEWTASHRTDEFGSDQIIVADLYGDGQPEVIVDWAIFDGATGVRIAEAEVQQLYSTVPTVGDLDGDGIQEVLFNGVVHDANGALLWAPSSDGGPSGWRSAILDIDGDADPEVVLVGDGGIETYDHTGALLFSHGLPGRGGPPCVADFDGDGGSEIAVPARTRLLLFDLDGSDPVWEVPITDISSAAGCSAYDLDGDGAHEVLHGGEDEFKILDGRTGATLYSDPEHTSRTILESPSVADLDGDGSAEVVVASSNMWNPTKNSGITVCGHAQNRWVRADDSWPVHDWTLRNVTTSGEVPPDAIPTWEAENILRAGLSRDNLVPMTDLVVYLDGCVEGCTDASLVRLAVQVGNAGADYDEPFPVAVYRGFPGEDSLLDVFELDPILAGTTLAAVERTYTRAEVGDGNLYVRVGDDGTGIVIEECVPADNAAVWIVDPC